MHDAGMTRVPGAPSFHSLIVKGWETTLRIRADIHPSEIA